MDMHKIDKQLKKIQTFVDTLRGEEVSPMERDLLLKYAVRLTEAILDAAPAREDQRPTESTHQQAYQEKIQSHAPIKAERQPVVEAISEVVRKEILDPSPVATPAAAEHASSEDVATETAPQEPEVLQIPEEYSALFTLEESAELSDRLARAPIRDLTRSMGINERIFTVNELFGKDSALFNTSMDKLNSFSTFEEAKDYLLEHVAIDQEWASETKAKKAATFIKLVSRRYL